MDRTRAALLAIGLLAAVLGPVGAAAAATGNVDVEDYGYSPGEVRIDPRDEVRWTNQGSQVHTVTSDDPGTEDFDSGRLGKDDEFPHTFNQAGTYPYHCEIHDSMSGVVQVGPPPTTTTSSTTTSTTTTTTTTSPTTTTEPAPTTTTTEPAPTTTTTRPPPTTTVTTSRTPAGAESPAPTTTTAPPTTTTRLAATTTTAGETTTTTAPAASAPATPLGPEVPQPPPQEEDGEGDLAGQNASAPRSRDSGGGGADAGVILLVAAVLGAGAFGGWTLWKLRPGNT